MASRMKEDEKNEKIIRGLLKVSANKRCINCNSLGPQYVCTNFWTYVCANCSGIHREFTHRVKSVSMAKFTSQEVSALQGGGNERAREIYFKEFDPQRHFLPDRSNVEKLRDFIKHVYVERRYSGERSTGRISRMKGERDDASENRRVDTFCGSSRSPPYEDTYESRYHDWSSPGGRNIDRNFRNSYDERKSPRSDQETRRYGSHRRSTARFEVVDDRVRDDRFRNRNQNRKSEDRSISEGASKPEGRSPNHQKDVGMSSPPVVRPVRDILGEDAPPLQIGDTPKANGSMSADGSARTQRSASSNSLVSTDRHSAEMKRVNSGSLIDFNLDPEPPVAAASSDLFKGQTVPQPTTSPSVDGGDWASFGFAGQEKTPQSPSNATTLESALSQLSAPETAPAPQAPSSATTLESALPQLSTPETAPAEKILALPGHCVESFVKTNDGRQLPSMQQQQQPSLFSAVGNQPTVQQVTPPVGRAPNNQQLNSLLAPNAQGLLTASPTQPSQAASKLPQATGAAIPSQPLPAEAKPSGRKELPEDLFTITYSPAPVPVPGWQAATPHGMGFGMQYPNVMSMPAFPQQSKSTNPFDLGTEQTPVHAPTFPSMASLQPALPNMSAPSPLSRTSSFGAASPHWVPRQQPAYPSAIPPSAYMMQQAPSSMSPMRHQGIGGFGSAGTAFGTLGADQQSARSPQPTTPNSISSRAGNPFG